MAITRDILRVRDLEPALESIAHAVQDLYAFRYVTIVAAEGSGGDMVRRVMLGWPADVVATRKYERIVRADIIDVLKKQFEIVENVFFIPAEREFPWARSIYTGEASRDAPREAPDRWHERDSLAFVLPDYHGEMLAYISVDGPVDGKVPSLETLTSMQLFVNLTGLAVANAQAHVAEIERRELLEASQARLRHEATHDSLTGLPNRAAFSEMLAVKLDLARATPGVIYAVLFVDLDEFKSINDSLGHVAGDHMLNAVAEIMRGTIGPSDFVARLGGDEFAILVDARKSAAEIERVALAIHSALLTPIAIDSQLVYNTASIGIATIGLHDTSIEDVLRHADTAMYHAKSLGRAGHAFFDEDMHEKATRRLALMNDLRTAIERKQFSVAYQPIVALHDGRITGFEALVRWNHPTTGEVLPGEFVPLAEDIGLIVDIGRFVFAEACAKLAAWRRRAPQLHLNMHVNFSVQEALKPDCDAFVVRTLARSGLSAGDITLELTETAIMRSGNAAQAAFERLHATGIRLCVDDFGTGYSSLRYLHQFPVASLKIDRSFVESADGELGSVSIVRIIIQLAEHFGIAVVAEGVETEAQAHALEKLGCAYAQGFHFHRPLAVEAVDTLLDAIGGDAALPLPTSLQPAGSQNGKAARELKRVAAVATLPPPVSRRGRRIRDLPIVAKPA